MCTEIIFSKTILIVLPIVFAVIKQNEYVQTIIKVLKLYFKIVKLK